VERWHRTLKSSLKALIGEGKQSDWVSWTPYVVYAYRNSVHKATRETPQRLIYGEDSRIPLDDFPEPDMTHDADYVTEMTARLQAARTAVAENLREELSTRLQRVNKEPAMRDFIEGELVARKRITGKGESRKLAPLYDGPWRVEKRVGQVTYQIRKVPGGKVKTVHAANLKPFFQRMSANLPQLYRELAAEQGAGGPMPGHPVAEARVSQEATNPARRAADDARDEEDGTPPTNNLICKLHYKITHKNIYHLHTTVTNLQ
jgi:hypothetical protein